MKKFFFILAGLLALACVLFPEVAAATQSVVAFIGPENLAAISMAGTVATTIVKDVAYTGQNQVKTQPDDSEVTKVPIPINFPVAAPVANDMHLLCKLLPNVQPLDFTLLLDDGDSGSNAAFSIGEANSTLDDLAVVYLSGITLAQAGGLLRFSAATAAAGLRALGAATLSAERVIAIKWTTAAAGGYVASTKGLLLLELIG